MKRFSIIMAVIFTAVTTYAQSLEKAKDLLKENKLAEAKSEIDKVLSQEKNAKNADAWYTKSKIYVAIAYSPLKSSFPDTRPAAFEALKKYTQLDDKMLIALQMDGYKPVNELYTNYYQNAATSFNKQDFTTALADFKSAIQVSTFMSEKGWINLKLDTNSVLYAGVAAEKMNKLDEAVKYYGLLVENKAKGDGFEDVYKWVANYYYEKKDKENTNKFVALGKQVYPNDPFWGSIELDMIRDAGSKEDLFAKYEDVIASNPANHLYRYNYAVELYGKYYNTDASKRPSNSAEQIDKALVQVREAIRIKPDYPKAQLFAGQIEYNKGVDFLNAAKNTTLDAKSKADLKANAIRQFDLATPYFLQVDRLLGSKGKLEQNDKEDLKEAYDLLITIYEQKSLSDKVKEFEAKFNDVERKH